MNNPAGMLAVKKGDAMTPYTRDDCPKDCGYREEITCPFNFHGPSCPIWRDERRKRTAKMKGGTDDDHQPVPARNNVLGSLGAHAQGTGDDLGAEIGRAHV